MSCSLKGLFHRACLARVVSWFAFVVAIFMGHENGDKQRATKSRHMQGMLDETGPLTTALMIHTFLSRDVGSISNLGDTTPRGHFSLKKKGHFLKIKRALRCLLQNLGGTCPPVPPPAPTSMFLSDQICFAYRVSHR